MASGGATGSQTGGPTLEFIGNATVLLRCCGFVILTDPNFLHRGQHAYLGWGLTSRRLTEPARTVTSLPELDVIVLSHLHGDHWDRIARRGLPRNVVIVTTPHAARRLQGLHRFRRADGLRTWERRELVKDGATLRITALPGLHAPGLARHLLPPVMGSMVECTPRDGGAGHRIYLTGDTLFFHGIREIVRRFPAIDAAVVHLGGTRLPGGLLVTMDGAQGAELVAAVRPERAVPIHYDDYGVFTSPLDEFTAEVRRRGLEHLLTFVERGDTVALTGTSADTAR